MRVLAFFIMVTTVGFVAWFAQAEDDCATRCAKERAAAEQVEAELESVELANPELAKAESGDDCDDRGNCPIEDDGCDDCATCMCCASTAPAATVEMMAAGHPALPSLDGEDSTIHPRMRARPGFIPGVFKPPQV